MSRPEPRIRLFLDSGAFSDWGKGETIKIEDYIKFVHDVKDYCWAYANLDVIPGSPKGVRTVEQVQRSAEQSYRNLQIMKDAGLSPLPVFHHMESYSWLEKMIKDGEDYIGISTAKNMVNLVQNRWLDEFFSVVTVDCGNCHGSSGASSACVYTLSLVRGPAAGPDRDRGLGRHRGIVPALHITTGGTAHHRKDRMAGGMSRSLFP
jgi:hypothetical protein